VTLGLFAYDLEDAGAAAAIERAAENEIWPVPMPKLPVQTEGEREYWKGVARGWRAAEQ
jgi:hypothetical protein